MPAQRRGCSENTQRPLYQFWPLFAFLCLKVALHAVYQLWE
ncbi:MAG: hypothetical protein Q8P67_15520 [archaeon]|nr:hypothetical protein [archaeon]